MTLRTRPQPVPAHRRGSVYALVLGTVAIAVAMVLGGLELSQISSRRARAEADLFSARALADSALEQALWRLTQESGWREAFDGVDINLEVPTLDTGTMSARVFDPDGDLLGNDQDDAIVWGIGTAGGARQIAEATIRPAPRAVGALRSAVHAAGAITITGSIVCDAPITSAASIAASGSARVGADVQAPAITGAVYLRRTSPSSPGHSVPSEVDAPAYWAAQGTSIPISAISGRKIEHQYIGPTSNPWGLPNARGIYVIDCQTQTLTISDTAIDGTLVLLNTGAATVFSKGVRITAPPGQPALVVQGPATISIISGTFEVPVLGGGTIIGGVLGGTGVLTTTQTSGIEGIVHITGACTVQGATSIYGALIAGGTLTLGGAVTVRHMPDLLDAPPMHYWDALLVRIAPASWKQAVDE